MCRQSYLSFFSTLSLFWWAKLGRFGYSSIGWRASGVCVMMDGTVCLHKCGIINKDPRLAGGEPVLHPTVHMKGVHPCAAGLISSLVGNKSPLCFSVCAQHLTRVWITDNCAKFRVAKTVGKVTPWQPLPDSGWRTLKCNAALWKRWNLWKTNIYNLVFMSYSYQPSPLYWTTGHLAGSNHSFEGKLCKRVWVIWVWGFVIKRNIYSNVASMNSQNISVL